MTATRGPWGAETQAVKPTRQTHTDKRLKPCRTLVIAQLLEVLPAPTSSRRGMSIHTGNNLGPLHRNTKPVVQRGSQQPAMGVRLAWVREFVPPQVALAQSQQPPGVGDRGPDKDKPAEGSNTTYPPSPTTTPCVQRATRVATLLNATGWSRVCRNAEYRHARIDHDHDTAQPR